MLLHAIQRTYKYIILYIQVMTATLYDILKFKMINVGDNIEFTFKQHFFRAKIIRGGLIAQCTVYRPRAEEAEKILSHHNSFSSLTSWTEACLQEILEEYFTRYSSWKRVYHLESGRTLGDLRDRCKLLNGRVRDEDTLELYKEIYRLQTMVKEMSSVLKTKNLFKKKWEIAPLVAVRENVPYKKVKKRKIKDVEAFNKVQELMMS